MPRNAWSGPNTVVRTRVKTDRAVDRTKVLSDRASSENAVRDSSLVARLKNRLAREKVTTPMVSPTVRSKAPSAQVMTPRVAMPMMSPTTTSQAICGRGRIGSSGSRGPRSIRPVPGFP